LHSLCYLCGSDDVSFLVLEELPDSSALRKYAHFRVDSCCAVCAGREKPAPARIIAVQHTLIVG